MNEDLRKWFGKGKQGGVGGGGWDRYDTSGNRVGKCGDAKAGDPYSACLSREKAEKLGKEGRAAFVKRKRAAQSKGGDSKKGGEHIKGQKPIKVKTGINEIGDSRAPSYELNAPSISTPNSPAPRATYTFETDEVTILNPTTGAEEKKKFKYRIEIEPKSNGVKNGAAAYQIEIAFDAIGHSYNETINANVQYRIMPTVVKAVKDYLSKYYKAINAISFVGAKSFDREQKPGNKVENPRAELYIRYIQNELGVDRNSVKQDGARYTVNLPDDYVPAGAKVTERKNLSLTEQVKLFLERNVPTDPEKWAYYKAQAKKKFDVYPSAYANGWAVAKYKKAGGGWRKSK